jgi:hypothetical protein
MFTSIKAAAAIATAVVAAHATVGIVSFNTLQTAADRAVMPIVKADPIIVTAKSPKIYKAEAIIVRAKAPGSLAQDKAATQTAGVGTVQPT